MHWLEKRQQTHSEEEMRKHRCAFTGHRPEKLWGDEGRILAELRKEILSAIDDDYTTFLTGCSRGADLWAADIVIELRRHRKSLKLICAVPFEGFETRWPVDWIKHYQRVRKQTDWVQVISNGYSPSAYQKRNIWLVRHASRLIGVWNGSPSGTKNTIDYAICQNVPVHIIRI